MAMVSVDVEGLRQLISDLQTGRTDSSGAALDLQNKLSSVGVWSPGISDWLAGQAYGWLTDTINYLQRRLEYAELLQMVTVGNLSIVSFDDSVLSMIDAANVSADVRAAVEAVRDGDVAGLQAILDRYTITTDDILYPFYDPVFSRAFALAVGAQNLSEMLVGLDNDRDLDLIWYDGFLYSLAGVLSTGAREMTYSELDKFTKDWTSVTNGPEYLTYYDARGRPSTVAAYTPNIQALSLLVARGEWPGSFLTQVTDSIQQQEGDQGVGYWLNMGVSVRDPGLVDPDTGESLRVCDPMYGVWQAAVQNPQWFLTRYGSGESRDVEYISSARNDPTHLYDTSIAEVFARLDDVFHRGFDQASFSALMSAVIAVDVYELLQGHSPFMVEQAQLIGKAMILESAREKTELPGWIHTGLDLLSMIPVVDIIADGFNTLFYWAEGDTTNAALSAGFIFIPGFLDLPMKGLKWVKKLFKIGDDIAHAYRPTTKSLAELAALGEKYTAENVLAITHTMDGKLVWLEKGNESAGLQHILDQHTADFLKQGIPPTEIPNYLMTALSEGRIVGTQGNHVPPRMIYEFIYKGETRQVAIEVGSNGFIVSANPR